MRLYFAESKIEVAGTSARKYKDAYHAAQKALQAKAKEKGEQIGKSKLRDGHDAWYQG